MKYDILILDSGFSGVDNEKVEGFSVKLDTGKIVICPGDIKDNIGHGTIIYKIIRKYAPTANICVVKCVDKNNSVDENMLYGALKYISENISCRVINLSLGIRVCDEISKFRQLCSEIKAKGTIIVSAFDNENCYSYPACFDEVIGVDSNEAILNIEEYQYVEASPVNIRAKGGMQRIRFNEGNIAVASGSSIACAYMSAYIANFCRESSLSFREVLQCLKAHAAYVYNSISFRKTNKDSYVISGIRNAAVFPVGKEAHAFIRFNNMLRFDIKHYYDAKYSGKVGMKISNIYPDAEEKYIEDIEKAEFEDIDTIIIGHLDELNKMCGCDYREKVLKKACKKGINVYLFDAIPNNKKYIENIRVFSPSVCECDVLQNTFGKLYKISKPVVGVFGTSSKQGKFSLQLTLKRLFEEKDYRVGCIGTEPHSPLFNMDAVYPMGYNSTVFVSPWQSITYLNHELYKLCEQNAEIIFVASQAGSAPQNYNNLMDYPIKQSIFLMGTHPDAIVLCINVYDDIPYIKNTMQVLQGLSDAKVIAFVMYPLGHYKEGKNFISVRASVLEEEYEHFAEKLHKEFGLSTYLLGNSEHMRMLCQEIIDFF